MVFNSDKMERFSILVSAENQNSGVGSRLIEFMKIHNTRLTGWVIDNNNAVKMNGEIYKSPIMFYLKHGFNIEEKNRIDNELLNAVLISWQK
jgi:GNAT superfamily N-acetyltransferase